MIVYNGTLPSQDDGRRNDRRTGGARARASAARAGDPRRRPRRRRSANHLRWFDARPLFGKRVLVTRPREQAAELVDRLTVLGAEAIEAPMIRIAPPEDLGPLRRAADNADDFDWIVFTSANAVEAFMTALLDGTRDVRALKGPRLCTVGTGTAERLARYGIKADLIPDEFRAEALVAAMADSGSLDGCRVLLPRADIGREVIAEGLRDAGALVTDVVAYRTVLDDAQQDDGPDVYRMLLDDAHRRGDVHQPVGGAQLRVDLRRGADDRSAVAHGRRRHRAGDRGGGDASWDSRSPFSRPSPPSPRSSTRSPRTSPPRRHGAKES